MQTPSWTLTSQNIHINRLDYICLSYRVIQKQLWGENRLMCIVGLKHSLMKCIRLNICLIVIAVCSLFCNFVQQGLPNPVPKPAPSITDTILKQGREKFAAGDTVEAEKLFHSVLQIDHANTTANFNLGVITERRTDWQGALHYYQAALQTSPNDKEIQRAVLQMNNKLVANRNVFSEHLSNQVNNQSTSTVVSINGSPHCPVCTNTAYNPPQHHCPGCANCSSASSRVLYYGLRAGLSMALRRW